MTFDEWKKSVIFTQQVRSTQARSTDEWMREAWNAATMIEREACAKIVDGLPITKDGMPAIKTSNGSFYKDSPMFYETYALAAEIRARGNK